jgi:hypothetical protein
VGRNPLSVAEFPGGTESTGEAMSPVFMGAREDVLVVSWGLQGVEYVAMGQVSLD